MRRRKGKEGISEHLLRTPEAFQSPSCLHGASKAAVPKRRRRGSHLPGLHLHGGAERGLTEAEGDGMLGRSFQRGPDELALHLGRAQHLAHLVLRYREPIADTAPLRAIAAAAAATAATAGRRHRGGVGGLPLQRFALQPRLQDVFLEDGRDQVVHRDVGEVCGAKGTCSLDLKGE